MQLQAIHLFTICCLLSASCGSSQSVQSSNTMSEQNDSSLHHAYYSRTDTSRLELPDSVWKTILSEELYAVAREAATERAFTGKFWNHEGNGIYYCAACGNPLFRSDSKFASGCGWPSFYQSIRPKSVVYKLDESYGMIRTEVICGRCDAHLGHIFDDGPPPTGKRFCMNSVSLDFEPEK
jgi:peptide-methionine (R)-S-oxide reductase